MTTQKITLSSSRDIPLNKLVLSQSNVRRLKAGISVEELAQDIGRRGLLQSLNVRPVLDDGQQTGMFEVPAAQEHDNAVKIEPFQVWTLKVNDHHKGTVTCDDGNGKTLYRQDIDYTDFPLPAMKLYCCADGLLGQGIERVILLPSEY